MLSLLDRFAPEASEDEPIDGGEATPAGDHWGSGPGFDLGDLIAAPAAALGAGFTALDTGGRFVRTAIGSGGDFGKAWDATWDPEQATSSTDLRRELVDDFGTEGDGFFRGSANPMDWDYGDILDFAGDSLVDFATNPASLVQGGLSSAGKAARGAGQKLWGGLRNAERVGKEAGLMNRTAGLSEGLAMREVEVLEREAARKAQQEARDAAIAGFNTETVVGGKRVARELTPGEALDPAFEGLESNFAQRAKYGQNAVRVGLPFTEGVEIPLPQFVANAATVAVDPLSSVLGPVWDVAKQTAIGQKVGKWLGGMRDAVINPAVRGLAGMSEGQSDKVARNESMRLWREHFEPAQKELLAAGVPEDQWGFASQLAENLDKSGTKRTAEYDAVIKDIQALPEQQRTALLAASERLKAGYEESLRIVQKYDPEFKSLNSDLTAKLTDNQADIEKTLTRLVKARSAESIKYEKLKSKLATIKAAPSTADKIRGMQQELRENADAIEKQIRTRTFPYDEAEDNQLTQDLADLGYSDKEIMETLAARRGGIDAQATSAASDPAVGALEASVPEETSAIATNGPGRPQGKAGDLTSFDENLVAGAKAKEVGDAAAAGEAYSAAAKRATNAITTLQKSGADVSEFLSPKDIKRVRQALAAANEGKIDDAERLLFEVEGDLPGLVEKSLELGRGANQKQIRGARAALREAEKSGDVGAIERAQKELQAQENVGSTVNAGDIDVAAPKAIEDLDGDELLGELDAVRAQRDKAMEQAQADILALKDLKAQIEAAKSKSDAGSGDIDVDIRRVTQQAGNMSHMEAMQQQYIKLAAKARKQFDAEIPKLTEREAKIVNEMSRIERAAQARDKLVGLLRNADGSVKAEIPVIRDDKGVRPALAAGFSKKNSDAVKAVAADYEKSLYGSISPEERVLLNRLYRKQERGAELFSSLEQIPNYVATKVNVEFAEDALARKAADVMGAGGSSIQKQRWRDDKGIALTARERSEQLQRGGGVDFAPGLSIPEAIQGFFKPDAVKTLRAGKVLTEDPFENASAYIFGPLQKTIANANATKEFRSVFQAVDEGAWNKALAAAAKVSEDGTPAKWDRVVSDFKKETGVALDSLLDPRVVEQVKGGLMPVADALKPGLMPAGWTKVQDFGGKSAYLPAEAARRYAKYVSAGTEKLPEFLQTVLAPLETYTRMWKKWQLRAWPNYHIRNFIGDMFRMFQEDALDANTPSDMGALFTGLARSAKDVGEKGFDGRYGAWAGSVVDVGERGAEVFGSRQVDLQQFLQKLEGAGGINQGYTRDIVDNAKENTKRGWFKKTWEANAPKELSIASDSAKWASGFATGREDMQRAASMLARLRRGDSWEEAAIRTEETLFNYGRISPAAKLLSRTGLAPFAAWTAKNLPAQVKWTMENPGAAAAVASALQRVDAGQIPEYMLGEYMKDQFNVVVDKKKDAEGKEQWMVTSPDGLIPLTDLHHLSKAPKQYLLGTLGPLSQLALTLDNREGTSSRNAEGLIGKPLSVAKAIGEGYESDGLSGALDALAMKTVVPLSVKTMNVEREAEKRQKGFASRLGTAERNVKKARGELNQAVELGNPTLLQERQSTLQAMVKKQRQTQAQVAEEREQTEKLLRTARRMQLAP